MTPKKAKAPRPTPDGQEAEAEQVNEAMKVTEFKVRGETVGRLAAGNVPLSEKRAVREQLACTWFDVLGRSGVPIDIWNLTVFIWLARRASGEPGLTWADFEAGWDNTVRADEIEMVDVDSETDAAQGDEDPQP
jgi:hypothetical protein